MKALLSIPLSATAKKPKGDISPYSKTEDGDGTYFPATKMAVDGKIGKKTASLIRCIAMNGCKPVTVL